MLKRQMEKAGVLKTSIKQVTICSNYLFKVGKKYRYNTSKLDANIFTNACQNQVFKWAGHLTNILYKETINLSTYIHTVHFEM